MLEKTEISRDIVVIVKQHMVAISNAASSHTIQKLRLAYNLSRQNLCKKTGIALERLQLIEEQNIRLINGEKEAIIRCLDISYDQYHHYYLEELKLIAEKFIIH